MVPLHSPPNGKPTISPLCGRFAPDCQKGAQTIVLLASRQGEEEGGFEAQGSPSATLAAPRYLPVPRFSRRAPSIDVCERSQNRFRDAQSDGLLHHTIDPTAASGTGTILPTLSNAQSISLCILLEKRLAPQPPEEGEKSNLDNKKEGPAGCRRTSRWRRDACHFELHTNFIGSRVGRDAVRQLWTLLRQLGQHRQLQYTITHSL